MQHFLFYTKKVSETKNCFMEEKKHGTFIVNKATVKKKKMELHIAENPDYYIDQ
jgi:hypothetical protein